MKLIDKIKGSKLFKRCTVMASALSLAVVGAVCASAEVSGAPTPTDVTAGVETVTSSILSNFTITQIAGIIAIPIGACIALMLFWWGARKVKKMVMSAFTKGKLSV